jgi:hypothetical protein
LLIYAKNQLNQELVLSFFYFNCLPLDSHRASIWDNIQQVLDKSETDYTTQSQIIDNSPLDVELSLDDGSSYLPDSPRLDIINNTGMNMKSIIYLQ